MSSVVRQQKVAKLIQKELGDIFLRDKHRMGSTFLTATEVRMSPDLSVAKVYVSVLLEADKKSAMDKIMHRKSEIRKSLGDRIRNQVRLVPELIFVLDEAEEHARRLDALIEGLHIPKEK